MADVLRGARGDACRSVNTGGERIWKIVPGGEEPAALTFHVNGPLDGGWCVIDGWTSKQARDEFLESRVKPVFENVQLPNPPVFEDLVVESVLTTQAPIHASAS